jgi:hypothetical protein
MLKTFTAKIESRLPFAMPPAAIIATIKSAAVLQPNFINQFKIVDVQATQTTPQRITVVFTEEIAERIATRVTVAPLRSQSQVSISETVEPISVGQPQAIIAITTAAVFIAAIIGALGLFFLVSLEEVGPIIKQVATESGSAFRFGSVAIIALVLGFAFLQLR